MVVGMIGMICFWQCWLSKHVSEAKESRSEAPRNAW
jgi:hypothetical protein